MKIPKFLIVLLTITMLQSCNNEEIKNQKNELNSINFEKTTINLNQSRLANYSPPIAGSVLLHRFYNNDRHLYVTNLNNTILSFAYDRDYLNGTWQLEGGTLEINAVANARCNLALYQMRSNSGRRILVLANERNTIINLGWNDYSFSVNQTIGGVVHNLRPCIIGYVAGTPLPVPYLSNPVYRYRGTGNDDYLYTENFNELGNGGGGWSYQGIAFYR